MVTMFATVRDKHGALIRNLTKDDFALQQDGMRKRSRISRRIPIFRSRWACWWTPA